MSFKPRAGASPNDLDRDLLPDDMPQDRLEVAAYCGHPPALAALRSMGRHPRRARLASSRAAHPAKPIVEALFRLAPQAAVAAAVEIIGWAFEQIIEYSYGQPPCGHEPVAEVLKLASDWASSATRASGDRVGRAMRALEVTVTPSPEETAELLCKFLADASSAEHLWQAFDNTIGWLCSVELPYRFEALERSLRTRMLDAALTWALGRAARIPRPTLPRSRRYKIVETGRSHGGPMELIVTRTFFVIDRTTQEPIMSFTGSTDYGLWSPEDDGDGTVSGITDVKIGSDGRHLIIRSPSGIRTQPLPED